MPIRIQAVPFLMAAVVVRGAVIMFVSLGMIMIVVLPGSMKLRCGGRRWIAGGRVVFHQKGYSGTMGRAKGCRCPA